MYLGPVGNEVGEVGRDVQAVVGANNIIVGPLRQHKGVRGHMHLILGLWPATAALSGSCLVYSV